MPVVFIVTIRNTANFSFAVVIELSGDISVHINFPRLLSLFVTQLFFFCSCDWNWHKHVHVSGFQHKWTLDR